MCRFRLNIFYIIKDSILFWEFWPYTGWDKWKNLFFQLSREKKVEIWGWIREWKFKLANIWLSNHHWSWNPSSIFSICHGMSHFSNNFLCIHNWCYGSFTLNLKVNLNVRYLVKIHSSPNDFWTWYLTFKLNFEFSVKLLNHNL